MQEITEYALCSGCHACSSACPQQCIAMAPDADGFLRPVIDAARCVDCGLCKRVCPIERPREEREPLGAYACICGDEAVRLRSSSGGVFALLAGEVLRRGGAVVGAALDSQCAVEHIVAETPEELEKLLGSKYVQSRMDGVLCKTRDLLRTGRLVYFSGTPCQVSGLKAFLGKAYPNLLCQSVVCHGVPAPLVWDKYLDFVCAKHSKARGELQSVSFRDKATGWKAYSLKFTFRDGSCVRHSLRDDWFMRAFLSDVCLRPSCFDCRSKSPWRESDITLADFWGVDRVLPEMFDDKGTSLVVVSTPQGQALLESVRDKMQCVPADLQAALAYNTAATGSVKKPQAYDAFMEAVRTGTFAQAKAVLPDKKLTRLKNRIRRLFRCFKTKRS